MNSKTVLAWLDGIMTTASMIPSPAQPFAALAIVIKQIAMSAVKTYSSVSGKPLTEVIAELRADILADQKVIDDWNAAHPPSADPPATPLVP